MKFYTVAEYDLRIIPGRIIPWEII